MQTLSGFDASFLYSETTATPMHTLKVIVLDRDSRDRRSTEEWMLDGFERAVRMLPALRSVPRAPRSPLAHPRWEEVPVELVRHVRFARTWPRGPRALEEQIAAHLEGTLPRDRPLWSALVLEQSGSRKVTLAIKYHHALADGLGSGRMLEVLAGIARPLGAPEPARRGVVERLQEAFTLAVTAVLGVVRSLRFSRVVPFAGAREVYNAPVSSRRRVAFAKLSLADLRAAAAGVEGRVTINDVIVSLVASALGRMPDAVARTKPLVAAQPVAIGGPHDRGNQLSTMFVPVHVEESDPRACLALTSRSNAASKLAHEARGRDLVMRLSELTPAPFLRLVWSVIRRLPRPPANVVISNIAGSREPMTLLGARVDAIYLAGPLLPTTGLNVTFWSHDGVVGVCVLASDAIDPRAVARGIEDALHRLREPLADEAVERVSLVA